ncbi:uncharacterized protein N7459_002475 [Penicillium hispanicum]|uniref:uncharacterized protein n=1 Tax=Penicillium hispanicum TaxID=1080232 RepID=UPI0025421957|nr:uncharacterized protein N7459_002475 [Penicillium hispanicum]KAJ5586710.1 hypothetical protein N7459_002475 [Penicillium hispanicum]
MSLAQGVLADGFTSEVFLDLLLERVLRNEIAPNGPEIDIASIEEPIMSTSQVRTVATQIHLQKLPVEIIQMVLNRLFDLQTGDPQLTQASLHTLHTLIDHGSRMKAAVIAWLDTDRVREMFDFFQDKHLSYENLGAAQDSITAIDRWPRHKTTLAYDAAATCLECFELLCQLQFISLEGYDATGQSWLTVAIRNHNQPVIEYLIFNLTVEQLHTSMAVASIYQDGMPEQRVFGSRGETHPLVELAGQHNSIGFEKVYDCLVAAGVSLEDQLWSDKVKLDLCACVSPDFAERLFQNGHHIGNIIGEFTTSWHEAVHNPSGSEFLDWLLKRSSTSPNVRNFDGRTPLMEVAPGYLSTAPYTVPWLCEHSNLMERWHPGGSPAHALKIAAISTHPASYHTFTHILEGLPTSYTHQLGVAETTFNQIIQGLYLHRVPKTGAGCTASLEDYDDEVQLDKFARWLGWDHSEELETSEDAKRVAARKCQSLVRHLPPSWAGSLEQKKVCANARVKRLGFLTNSLITPMPETRKVNPVRE